MLKKALGSFIQQLGTSDLFYNLENFTKCSKFQNYLRIVILSMRTKIVYNTL